MPGQFDGSPGLFRVTKRPEFGLIFARSVEARVFLVFVERVFVAHPKFVFGRHVYVDLSIQSGFDAVSLSLVELAVFERSALGFDRESDLIVVSGDAQLYGSFLPLIDRDFQQVAEYAFEELFVDLYVDFFLEIGVDADVFDFLGVFVNQFENERLKRGERFDFSLWFATIAFRWNGKGFGYDFERLFNCQ